MSENRCVCCGEVIPEGSQVCLHCEQNVEHRKQWIEENWRPSSTMFVCPYCREQVYFAHGSSSKSRRRGLTKRCLYRFCPWCGKEVTPLRINYIEDDER